MFAPSYAALIGETAGTIAYRVEDSKIQKYQDITISHYFYLLQLTLGRRIKKETGESNAYFYLIQRISVALQQGNEVPGIWQRGRECLWGRRGLATSFCY